MAAKRNRRGERGATLLEFVIVAPFFLMMLVAVAAGGHLFYTHNAMVEATRRGARYAVTQCRINETLCTDYATVEERIKKVVVYGTPTPADGQEPFVPNLALSNVTVTTPGLGVAQGTAKVSLTNYQYPFVIPFISVNINMPAYSTTFSGEAAGFIPADK